MSLISKRIARLPACGPRKGAWTSDRAHQRGHEYQAARRRRRQGTPNPVIRRSPTSAKWWKILNKETMPKPIRSVMANVPPASWRRPSGPPVRPAAARQTMILKKAAKERRRASGRLLERRGLLDRSPPMSSPGASGLTVCRCLNQGLVCWRLTCIVKPPAGPAHSLLCQARRRQSCSAASRAVPPSAHSERHLLEERQKGSLQEPAGSR